MDLLQSRKPIFGVDPDGSLADLQTLKLTPKKLKKNMLHW